ncbi:MAG: SDR family oxidoreductase [Planctomycetota bacterium]|nr:MAG: SDR family oxidoreductase [Planctomycetota bacterium]
MTVERRVALVTGAAKRIGRAIALRLARRGYSIAVHYHLSGGEARKTCEECHRLGVHASCFQADLADDDAPRMLAKSVLSRFGRLDVLVNNASVFERMNVAGFDRTAWDRTLAINVSAPMALTAALAEALRAARGRVVNLGDAGVRRAWPNHLAYITSKGALETLTRTLARGLAPEVTVNAVAPGIAAWPDDYDAATRERLLAQVPLARSGTPEDVAAAVEYFVCEAEYVTGVVLPVDGGREIV